MSNLSSPFIERPKATSLVGVLIILSGILAYYFLPVSQLPQIEFPTILVQASLPGASPEIMATSVATPIEKQIGRISGVTEMTSSSSLGKTSVVIQFDLNRSIDAAANDVQAAIDASLSDLPKDLPSKPIYRKVNPADAPIMIIALTSKLYTKEKMYDVASTILQQKISQSNGVGQVIVGGSSLPSVRVELNPLALNHYGIAIDDIRTTLQNENANKPKGQIIDNKRSYNIATNDQLIHAYQYKPLIISYHNNTPVTLSDVAEVKDSVEDIKNAGLADGKPSVLLIIFKQPGVNVIETVDGVKQKIPQLEASIPAGIDLTVAMDRTTTIRSSLVDVEKTLILAIALVIIVVFLFLKNLSSTFIPSIVVPISLLGTFTIMYFLNFSLDNFSLMALTISTGFVVDDAIVVLENIMRHIEKGVAPKQAALLGSKEVSFTVLSMSISLIAVFIPILLMGGIVGRLFREFAITLSIAILVSLFVSLTITPSMCSKMLKVNQKKISNQMNKSKITEFYKKSLLWTINHEKTMLFVIFLTIILSIVLYIQIPKGFFPQQDTGRIMGFIVADQNISFKNMEKKFTEIVNIIKEDPAIEHVVGYVGGGTINNGNVFISLKPLEERKISPDIIIGRLRNSLSHIAGVNVYLQSAQDLMIGGRQGGAQFQYSISAPNLDELNKWGEKLIQRLSLLPGIADVNSDQKNHGLEAFININYDNAAKLEVTPFAIDNTLYDSFGQRQVSIIYKSTNQYHVVMEVAPEFWMSPEFLKNTYIKNRKNILVPLSEIANFSAKSSLLSVNHQSQFPATTLSFNLIPGTPLGDAVNLVEKTVNEMNLPSLLNASFQGTAKAFQSSLSNQPYLILAALITVYIVLGILYESLIHPITILSTLPSAGVGALLALIMTKTDFSLIALIGIILLIGIVKKNAIMMIDFALQAKRLENKTSKEAIYQAAILRFRPIMMTTMAAILGAVPLAFGTGVGSELRRPLGISIIGGLIISQLLTLYTTPIVYLYFEKIKYWIENKLLNIKGETYEQPKPKI